MLHHIALHRLPVQLRMLVRLIGDAAAFALVHRRGGTPLTVPTKLSDGAELLDLVGPQAAAQLVAELRGQTLQLPKYDSVTRQLRHQRVVLLRGKGQKLREVALATGYTVRQVINVCNVSDVAADAPAAQQELFADADIHVDVGVGVDVDMDVSATASVICRAPPVLATSPASPAHDPFGLAAATRQATHLPMPTR